MYKSLDSGDIILILISFGVVFGMLKYFADAFIKGINNSIGKVADEVGSMRQDFTSLKDATTSLDKTMCVMAVRLTNTDDKFIHVKEVTDNLSSKLHSTNAVVTKQELRLHKLEGSMLTVDTIKELIKGE